MNDAACWLRLQLTPGLGRIGLLRLIDHYGSPQAALAADPGECRSLCGVPPRHDRPAAARR